MQCTRCAGMQVPEMIFDGGMRIMAVRCVICGNIVDQVIARNRQRRRHPKPARARSPVYPAVRKNEGHLPKIIIDKEFTKREQAVLSRLQRGETNKEIGIMLCISPRTVQKHLERIYKRIYNRLAVRSRHNVIMALQRVDQNNHVEA